MKRTPFFYLVWFFLFPWLVVFLLRQSGLIGYGSLSSGLIGFLVVAAIVSIVFFAFGFVGGSVIKVPKVGDKNSGFDGDLRLVAGFSSVFLVLMLIDFFVIKEGGVFSITDIREADNLGGARMSLMGGVIAISSAAPYMLMGMLIYSRSWISKKIFKIFTCLALAGIAVGFLTGGRNAFVIGVAVIVAQYLLLGKNPVDFIFSRKSWLVSLLFVFFVVFSLYVFAEREMNQGVEPHQIVHIFQIKWGVDIPLVQTNSEFFDILYAIAVILVFYFTHALSYIDDYFLKEVISYSFGAYNFPIPAKAIEVIFGFRVFSGLENGLITPGVYLTLPGSLYIDFGFVGACIFLGVMAMTIGILLARRRDLEFTGVFFLSFLLAAWAIAPLYSMFAMANGFSFIVLFFLLLCKKLMSVAINRE